MGASSSSDAGSPSDDEQLLRLSAHSLLDASTDAFQMAVDSRPDVKWPTIAPKAEPPGDLFEPAHSAEKEVRIWFPRLHVSRPSAALVVALSVRCIGRWLIYPSHHGALRAGLRIDRGHRQVGDSGAHVLAGGARAGRAQVHQVRLVA